MFDCKPKKFQNVKTHNTYKTYLKFGKKMQNKSIKFLVPQYKKQILSY